MKKLAKGLLTVALAAVMTVGIASCTNKAESAYDVAVKNGFVGTEAEWLRSLHGADGEDGQSVDAQGLYQAAVENGFTGSFLEFCAALNITVPTQNDVVQISENVSSVVSIYARYSQTTQTGGWFGSGTTKKYGSQAGSGVIVDLNRQAGNAYIITNYHVVYNLESDQKGILSDIWVYPYGAYNDFDAAEGATKGKGVKARYVGGAMDYDIAILQVEGSAAFQTGAVSAAKFGDSEKVTVGEETFVIGNPAGAGIAVTNGILSVDSEYIGISALDNRDVNPKDGYVDTVAYRVMRTSAAINSGNSGGGMFNTAGELIGIVNAKNAQTTTDNMGYALPSTQVKAVYDNILTNGNCVKQARLGVIVSLKESKAVLDTDGKISVHETFIVSTKATEETEASYNKLFESDQFVSASVNGGEKLTFTRKHQLTDMLLTVRRGDTVTFTVLRENQYVDVPIVFGDGHFTVYA